MTLSNWKYWIKVRNIKTKKGGLSWALSVKSMHSNFFFFFFLTANIFALHVAEPEEKITNSLYVQIPKTWTKSSPSLWGFCYHERISTHLYSSCNKSHFCELSFLSSGGMCTVWYILQNHVCVLVDIFPLNLSYADSLLPWHQIKIETDFDLNFNIAG